MAGEASGGGPTESPIANVYFQAARRLGLDVTILSAPHGVGTISYRGRGIRIHDRWVGINNLTSSMLCGNKHFATRELARHGIPVPDPEYVDLSGHFSREATAKLLVSAARGRYPVCIKPVTGSHGMQVVPDIRDEQELLRVLFFDPLAGRGDTLLETHHDGRHYRVIMASGELIGCVERRPPQVVGDGRHTLGQLVDAYNALRRDWNLEPAPMGYRQRYIVQRAFALGLDDRVPPNLTVRLDDRCNLKLGGTIHYVDPQTVTPSIRELCARAVQVFELGFAGLDLIGGDITREQSGEWVINEVNSQPAAHVPVPTMSDAQRLEWPARLLRGALMRR